MMGKIVPAYNLAEGYAYNRSPFRVPIHKVVIYHVVKNNLW